MMTALPPHRPGSRQTRPRLWPRPGLLLLLLLLWQLPLRLRLALARPALSSTLLCALLTGCAGLPAPHGLPPTHARPATADTPLGRLALGSTPAAQLTGFRLLPQGPQALDARLALIEQARDTLDLQYYHLADDRTGRTVMRALRQAADRGVRVRLLVDDYTTAGTDRLLAGLQAGPHLEVRLFNPFVAGRDHGLARLLGGLGQLDRLNHRMHNKLFVADGAMAIAGGRNLADSYFALSLDDHFLDLDAFMVGGVVGQLQQIFDDYWNSRWAWPLERVVATAAGAPQTLLRAEFDRRTARDLPPPAPQGGDLLGHAPLREDLASGWLPLIWSAANAYAGVPLTDVLSVRYELLEHLQRARQQIVLDSPYLVPGPKGLALLRDARQRGVAVDLLTNSFASTDVPLVALGYARYRQPLLAAGVTLHELSPARVRRVGALRGLRQAIGRLHAKTAVIDRRVVFFGSMNLDPRSEHVNTELGVIVDSPQLADELLRLMGQVRRQAALQVVLGADGQPRWLAPGRCPAPAALSPAALSPDALATAALAPAGPGTTAQGSPGNVATHDRTDDDADGADDGDDSADDADPTPAPEPALPAAAQAATAVPIQSQAADCAAPSRPVAEPGRGSARYWGWRLLAPLAPEELL